jgi:hypothetical protein
VKVGRGTDPAVHKNKKNETDEKFMKEYEKISAVNKYRWTQIIFIKKSVLIQSKFSKKLFMKRIIIKGDHYG